jgi:hypothetical protein
MREVKFINEFGNIEDTPFEKAADADRQRMYNWVDEGNDRNDLILMYLRSLDETEVAD